MSFCCPGLEASVKIVCPTDILTMIIEPSLTKHLDASEMCELGS
jgi:hypothetical protein